MFQLILAVSVCLLVIFIIWHHQSHRRLPPGPWGLPIVGYIPFLSRKPYLDFQRLAKKYGSIYSVRLGSQYVVVLNDFQSTKDACFQEAFIGRPPECPFDVNKETIDTDAYNGPPWIEQRKSSLQILRSLGFGKTKMEEQMREEINEFVDEIEKHEGEPYCVYQRLRPSVSNNISVLVFGKKFKYEDPVRQMLTRVLKEATDAAGQVTWHLFFPWIKNTLKFLRLGDVSRVARVTKDFKDYVMMEIENHGKSVNPNSIRDYIDGYLLEIEKRKDDPSFCKAVLQDMVGAFYGAGSFSIGLTVEWLVLLAAVHQQAQLRIYKEIVEVIGCDRRPLYLDHKSMPFTEAFIKELWRWSPILPVNILRYALTDSELQGYYIPKHSQLLANLWAIHHDTDYWGADVDEFKPERFLSEDGQTVKKWEQFIPFSIGKRACPAQHFAKTQVFLYFTSILQRLHVKLPDGKVADFEGQLGLGFEAKPQELIYTKRS